MDFFELLKKKFFPDREAKEAQKAAKMQKQTKQEEWSHWEHQSELADNKSTPSKAVDLQDQSEQISFEPSEETTESAQADILEAEEISVKDSKFSRSSRNQRSKPRVSEEEAKKHWYSRLILPHNHPIRRFWRRFYLTRILLIMTALVVLVVGSYLFFLAKSTKVSDLQDALKATTVIYDKDEQYAGSLSGQKGTYVELDAISDDLENAVIATEDRSFYENSGINIPRYLLAIVTLGRTGGGSTITQQLAKNAYLTQEQTITRKAKEFFLALELTKAYSKQEILTMYLNNAYFGNGVWGVEDASQKYFGTSAANLTLDEAATLAGMLKGPSIYNPYYSIENATNRRDTVLSAMVDAGMITEETATENMAVGMGNRLADTYAGTSDDYKYPSYFDAVINEAISVYGLTEKEIVDNGYKIYTELDQNYQSGMQSVFDNTYNFPTSSYDGSQAQAASVALDPSTGGVRGLVGRVQSSSASFRSFNFATQSKRSPGSTIKPLVVYSPAIASGWAIDTELPNSAMDFNGYAPSNYGGFESESIPMYQALAMSYNIPAVYTVDQLGINKAISYGEKFGLDMSTANEQLGLALGGSITTNPLQMAQAYSAFANGGVMGTAHLITRIEKANGETLKSYTEKSTRVISQSVADKMTSMMLGTFSNGTAVNGNVYGYTMAGKTGTTETEFNADLIGDQWVIGYTPDVVMAQWVGFENTDETHYIEDFDSTTLFSAVASYVLPYTAGNTFTVQNAYEANGIAATYSEAEVEENSRSIIDSLTDQAQQAADNINQAVEESGIGEKVKSWWDDLLDNFR
ncbi:penicillin-binding protein PBP2A [Streptococcus caprae]|uniref:Penicillin-binding protein PBP2A n=1 Tax=Streptococcus caprae TaxID=1640501 RepID=A0ABV8CT89_9STRE